MGVKKAREMDSWWKNGTIVLVVPDSDRRTLEGSSVKKRADLSANERHHPEPTDPISCDSVKKKHLLTTVSDLHLVPLDGLTRRDPLASLKNHRGHAFLWS